VNTEIIVSNLLKRPVRTAVSVLAVGMEVMLILVILGLVDGIKTDSAMQAQGVGADIMLQPPGAQMFLGLSQNVMAEELAPAIADLEGVEHVAPVVTQFNTQGGFDLVYGIDPSTYDQMSGGLNYLEGRVFQKPDEIVVDDVYADSENIGVGDTIELLNHSFVVSGIVASGRGARLYMGLEAAQEMTGDVGQVSLLYITVTDRDAVASVIDRIQTALPEYKITQMSEFLSLMLSRSHPALDAFLTAVVGVAVTIGLLVIFLSMYTTISERTREIGILRSMGASRGFVVKLILNEAAVLATVGVLAGLLASVAVSRFVPAVYPTIMILIQGRWILYATVLAILSALFGAIYPSFRAASQDPVEALAYE
jgi:putative ABC transport system permease protein